MVTSYSSPRLVTDSMSPSGVVHDSYGMGAPGSPPIDATAMPTNTGFEDLADVAIPAGRNRRDPGSARPGWQRPVRGRRARPDGRLDPGEGTVPVTAADRRWWFENTAPGQLHRAMGTDPFAVDHAAVDREVESVRQHYRQTYRDRNDRPRELTEAEIAQVRFGAELRSAPVAPGRVIHTTAQLVEAVNSASVSAGWSYQPVFRGQHSGVAVRLNGQYTEDSDPAVIATTEAAEEEKRRREEEAYESWRNGPLVMRTVAKPS